MVVATHVAVVWNDATAGLDAHVVWDRIVDVAKLSITVSVLAVFVPLAVAFVLVMSALLRLEPLIHRAHFNGALRLGHLMLHRLWSLTTHLHHRLLRHHNLRHILHVRLLRLRHLHLSLRLL